MPSIDDVYGDVMPPRAVRMPEVVTPSPAYLDPTKGALVRFQSDSALKNEALNVLNINIRPVETLEAAAKLANQRAQVKTLLKNIEHRRKSIVEPLKKEASSVDAEARVWTDPLKKWDQNVERVLLAFQHKQADDARRQEESRQQALRDAAKKQHEAEIMQNPAAIEAASTEIMHLEAAFVAGPITGFKTDDGTTGLRKRWTFEVVDASLVPDNYMVPDLKALQSAVDAGAREIPGTNIYEHESLPVRTR